MEFEKVKRKRGSEKNLKSYFFYLVFDLKTRLFPEDSLARYVQISQLYKTAVNQNVPIERWKEFIYE